MSTKEIYGVIYLIRNEINSKVYIGQTVRSFDERYYNNVAKYTKNEHLRRSIEKYGIENFYIDKEFDVAYSQEELDRLEDLYIKTYEATNPNKGYNKKFGGSSGKHTEETKNKLREINLGRKHTEETKNKLSELRKGKYTGENNPFYGRQHSEETIKKLRELNLGENSPNYGKRLSDETKKKLSEAKKGKKHTEETKQKLREINLGKKMPEEVKKKISESMKGSKSPSARRVICITTGKVFDTAKEGGEFYGCNRNHISSCCTGKRNYCGKLDDGTKLQWAYYEYYLLEINQAS